MENIGWKEPRNWAMRLATPLLIVVLALGACVSSSAKRIGSTTYPPLPPNTEVVVYSDRSQIETAYEVIGIASYTNPGKYQVLDLGDAIEPLKEKARELGGNGIVLIEWHPVKSGIISTGISVQADVIRMMKKVP